MPEYRCRKDGTDLTALVERALDDEGPGVASVDVVVEGSRPLDDMARDVESVLARAVREGREKLVPVIVTCPTDDAENMFLVRRRD